MPNTSVLESSVAAVVLEGDNHNYDNEVSHEFPTTSIMVTCPTTTTTTCTPPTTTSTPPTTTSTLETVTSIDKQAVDGFESVAFGGDHDSDHSYRHWLFYYTLAIQLTVVLLVTSLVVFYFLHFKQSSKVRGTIDLELQDLVINHQTFATDDTDPHNTDHEKEKSQIATASKTDKQIEAKLPDVINSRD